jgi:monooxygenase
MNENHRDVLIVGAGLSGIGAAHHLQKNCPKKTFALLERRERMGGTWDLFRYPGIRSDSDMYTLGFSFRPWTNPKAIADAPDILAYLSDTAQGLRHRSEDPLRPAREARLVVERDGPLDGGGRAHGHGRGQRFTWASSSCAAATTTTTAATSRTSLGMDDFGGRFVHPQFWPEDLDYAGKRVVVIGSGATAITLVPEPWPRPAGT